MEDILKTLLNEAAPTTEEPQDFTQEEIDAEIHRIQAEEASKEARKVNAFDLEGNFITSENTGDGDGPIQGHRASFSRYEDKDRLKSLDTWETSDAGGQEKLDKQRKALSRITGWPVEDITNEDVFEMGRATAAKAESHFQTDDGINSVTVGADNGERGKFGRNTGQAFLNHKGEDIRSLLNNPMDNAAFYDKWNHEGRNEFYKGTRDLAKGEAISDFDAGNSAGGLAKNTLLKLRDGVNNKLLDAGDTVAEVIGTINQELVAGESDYNQDDLDTFESIEKLREQSYKEVKLAISKEKASPEGKASQRAEISGALTTAVDNLRNNNGVDISRSQSASESVAARAEALLLSKLTPEQTEFLQGTGQGRDIQEQVTNRDERVIVPAHERRTEVDDRYKTIKAKRDARLTVNNAFRMTSEAFGLSEDSTISTDPRNLQPKDKLDTITGRNIPQHSASSIRQDRVDADTNISDQQKAADKALDEGNYGEAATKLLGSAVDQAVDHPGLIVESFGEAAFEIITLLMAPKIAMGLITNTQYKNSVEDFKEKNNGKGPDENQKTVILATATGKALINKFGADAIFKPVGKKATAAVANLIGKKFTMTAGWSTAIAIGALVEGGEESIESVLEQVAANQGSDDLIDPIKVMQAFNGGFGSGAGMKAIMASPMVPDAIKQDLTAAFELAAPVANKAVKAVIPKAVVDKREADKAAKQAEANVQVGNAIVADVAKSRGVTVEELSTPNIEAGENHDFIAQINGEAQSTDAPVKSDIPVAEQTRIAVEDVIASTTFESDVVPTEKDVLSMKSKLSLAEQAIEKEINETDFTKTTQAEIQTIQNNSTALEGLAGRIRKIESELSPVESSPLKSTDDVGVLLTRGSGALTADVDTSKLAPAMQSLVSELQSIVPNSKVSDEVLGNSINSRGKEGLAKHLSIIGTAISDGSRKGAAVALDRLVKFKVSQQNKHKAIQAGYDQWVSEGKNINAPVTVTYGIGDKQTYTIDGDNTQGFLNNVQKEIDFLERGVNAAGDLAQAHFDPQGFNARKQKENIEAKEIKNTEYAKSNTPTPIQRKDVDVADTKTSEAGEGVRAESTSTRSRTRQQILKQGIDVRKQMDSLEIEIANAPTKAAQDALLAEQEVLSTQRQELLSELATAPITSPLVPVTSPTKAKRNISDQPAVEPQKGQATESTLEAELKSEEFLDLEAAFDARVIEDNLVKQAEAKDKTTPVLEALVAHSKNVKQRAAPNATDKGAETESTKLIKPLSDMVSARKSEKNIVGLLGKSLDVFEALGNMSKEMFTDKQRLAVSDIEAFAHEIGDALDYIQAPVGSTAGLKVSNDGSGLILFRKQANESPIMQFLDENGELPKLVKDAIAVNVLDWFQTTANSTLYQSMNDVYNFFGKDPMIDEIPVNVLNKMAVMGTSLTNEQKKMGQAIWKSLNLRQSSNPELDANWEARMIMSLGQTAFVALSNMKSNPESGLGSNRGYIQFDSISTEELTLMGGNELTESMSGKLANFVKIPHPVGENGGTLYGPNGEVLSTDSLSELLTFTKSADFKHVMKIIRGSNRKEGGVTAVPNDTAPEYYTGTSTKASPLMKKYAEDLNKQALVKTPQWKLFEDFMGEHKWEWARIGGAIVPVIDETTGEATYPDLHDSQVKSAEGKNLSIFRDMDAKIDHDLNWASGQADVEYDIGVVTQALEANPESKNLKDKLSKLETELKGYQAGTIYIQHRFISTGRTSDGHSALSPQNNKDARNGLVLESGIQEVDIHNAEHQEALINALIEPLGLDAVRADVDLMGEFTEKYLDSNGLAKDPVIRKAVKAIQSHLKGEDFSRSDIADAVVAIGEGHHTLSGLMILADWSTLVQTPDNNGILKVYGYTEVDGTTNGVILGLRQLAGGFEPDQIGNLDAPLKHKNVEGTVNSGGGILKGQDYKNGVDYLKDNPDSYQRVGQVAGELIERVGYTIQNMEVDKLKVDVADTKTKMFKEINKIKRALKNGVKPADLQQGPLLRAREAVSLAETSYGIKVFGATLPNFGLKNGKVSSAIRKMMKSVVMPGGYQAGDVSLKRSLFNAWLDNTYADMAQVANERKASPTGPYEHTLDNINEVLENLGIDPVAEADAMSEFSFETIGKLQEAYNMSLGKEITKAYRDINGDFDEHAKLINAAHSIMAIIVKEKLTNAYAEAEAKTGNGAINADQRLEIMKELHAEGWFVGHAQYDATDHSESVSITRTEQVPVSDDRGGKAATGFNEGVITTNLHTVDSVSTSVTSSRTTTIMEEVPSSDVGLSGVITAVHHMDALVQAVSSSRSDVEALNIFDAKILSILEAAEETKNTNESMEIIMNDWSLWTATENQLKNLIEMAPEMATHPEMINFFRKFNKETKEGNKFAPTRIDENGIKVHYTGLADFVAHFSGKALAGNAQRIALNDAHIGQAQYNIKGGTYVIPREDTTDERGSTNQRIDTGSFDEASRAKATPEVITNLFTKYLEKNNVKDSPAHKQRLNELMTKYILPAVAASKNYTVSVENTVPEFGARTGGAVPVGTEDIYIRTSDEAIRKFSTDMSDAEVLTHEFLHPIIEAGLANNTKALVTLRKLQQAAIDDKGFTFKAFIDPSDIDQAGAEAKAKDLYSYAVLGDLQEFMTFGLSNNVVRTALQKVNVTEAAPLGVVSNMLRLLQNLINRVTGLAVGNSQQQTVDVATSLDNLIKSFDTTTRVHMSRHVASTVNNKYVTAGRGFLAEKVAAPLTAWGKTISYKVPVGEIATTGVRPSVKETLIAVAKAPLRIPDSKFQEALSSAIRPVMEHKRTVWSEIALEAMGPNQNDSEHHVVLSQVNQHVESAALNYSRIVAEKLKGAFKRTLHSSEHKMLADTLLRGDLKSLGVDTQDLQTLVSDTIELDEAIATSISNLRSSDKQWIIGQSKNLASLMINGIQRIPGGNANAFNIVMGVGRPEGRQGLGLDPADLTRVDQLKSLYAIKEMSASERNALAAMIEKEPEGIKLMLEVDAINHAETLRTAYKGDRSRVVAGEVVSKANNNSNTAIMKRTDEALHEAKGYRLVKGLGRHLGLYSRSGVSDEPYQKGSFSLGSTQLEGTVLDGPQTDPNGPIPIPIVVNGKVIGERVILDRKTRETEAGMSIGGIESLANHGGRIIRLDQGDTYNSKIIEMVHTDFLANAHLEPEAFVTISERAVLPNGKPDRQVREFAKMMSKAMRDDVKETWGGPMHIRKDQLNLLIGYRKMSIVDSTNNYLVQRGLDKLNAERRREGKSILDESQINRDKYEMNVALGSSIRLAGDLWQGAIAEVKRRTVLFTPAVIIANGLSNLAVSVLFGMNPVDVVRDQREGWTAISQYMEFQKEMGELELEIKLGRNVRENNLKRVRLQKTMESSGVHDMVEAGMFQSIVEDIDIAAGNANPISNTLSRALPDSLLEATESAYLATPDTIKKGLGVLMLSPSTDFGANIQAATAKSDFVARYAMLKYLRKEGVNEVDAMEQVREIFVDYAPNTSQELQYVNDSGLYMYTKFLMRIQRVIMKAFANRAEAVIALELGQQVLGEYPDIPDSSFLLGVSLSGGRSQNPAEVLESLSEFPLLRLFSGIYDWFL